MKSNTHTQAWLYVSLLFALSPAGTHPLRNRGLLEATGGPVGLSNMLDTLITVAVMQGWSGGAA